VVNQVAAVKTILGANLNVEDVLTADTIVLTRAAVTLVEEWLA